ncbi:hypothetical protein L249_5560 [Ophiocordyceps polyrhachis-furcata BCC 54312]|uniref:Uncharacterized protein n=1 Tax=Ophiocordyceps polyrhachis-furcata BCC 54312 TaxID=1330021 RepID=A0A367LGP7_9HYPO|nr:hypothetical protein L249_5560 [Ophiocordyceps polyrhachis-furcata BCC 54312]
MPLGGVGDRAGDEAKQDPQPRPPLTDLTDRRILTFWLLTIGSTVSFVFWVVTATSVSYVGRLSSSSSSSPASPSSLTFSSSSSSETQQLLTNSTLPLADALAPAATAAKNDVARRVSIDVWFAIGLTAALDAIAVVLTFNGLLIRRFHFAVSQRVMFLASAISYAVLQRHAFVARHPLTSVAVGIGLYTVFDKALDRFERPGPPGTTATSASRWGSLQRYSADLSLVESSWTKAAIFSACVGGFGLSLTMLVPPPWSALVPIVHIFFESVFLSAMGAKRTARYLILCSPVFFANICVHWGVSALVSAPRLAIRPSLFLALVLLGRVMLDLLLATGLRRRSELHWARRHALFTTPFLLVFCATLMALQVLGTGIVTYIKPTMVLAIYGLNGAGFLAIASYNVAFNLGERK